MSVARSWFDTPVHLTTFTNPTPALPRTRIPGLGPLWYGLAAASIRAAGRPRRSVPERGANETGSGGDGWIGMQRCAGSAEAAGCHMASCGRSFSNSSAFSTSGLRRGVVPNRVAVPRGRREVEMNLYSVELETSPAGWLASATSSASAASICVARSGRLRDRCRQAGRGQGGAWRPGGRMTASVGIGREALRCCNVGCPTSFYRRIASASTCEARPGGSAPLIPSRRR